MTNRAHIAENRPTIGVLITQLRIMYETAHLIEISAIARQRGVNVICMVGGDFLEDSPNNSIFDLIHPATFSGLIISGTLGRTVSPAQAQRFCEHFAPLPIVSGAFPATGITQVLPDSARGMRAAVEHLIVEHNCRRIAFIRGPEGQKEAEERFQAYLDVLTQYALPVAPELIANGDYWRSAGRAAMQTLLDRAVSLDAVVVANDDMAIGAFEVLQMRGVRVPEDVALVGFDDMLEASLLPVPLTTVRQSYARSAQTMVDVLLRRMDGERFPAEVIFPTELVIRQSCGCLSMNQPQQRTAVHEQIQRQQKMTSLQYFNKDLVAILALEELGPVIEQHFPALDIHRGYIALYEEAALPPHARLILAYTAGKVELLGNWPAFPLHHLAPAEMLPQEQGYTLIAIPFLLRDQQLGFGLFEIELNAQLGEIYDRLGEQFSGALFRVLLLQQLDTVNQALRQNVAELEASNAELDAFAHTVAHDLKTPLTALIGFSNLLETRWPYIPAEKIVGTLQHITAAGYKLARIVDELLLLASVRKMEQVQTGTLDMRKIIAETRERLADMIAVAQAEIVAPETWPEVVGYAPWVEEVWANYLSNALKYGGTPPRVELGFSRLEPGGASREASNQHPVTSIQFWVQDNGMGLTPEAQAQLFTEFARLEQTRAEGHGLGLSIVQRIIAKLGGEVGVESAVGRGSRFWFTLPVADELPINLRFTSG